MNHTIEWQHGDGSSEIVLSGSGDAVSEFRQNGQLVAQVRGGVRAATTRPLNRRNLTSSVSFLVAIAPAADPEAALAYILAQSEAIEAAEEHELLVGEFGEVAWELANATLQSFELWQMGSTVYARYSFIGGSLTDES